MEFKKCKCVKITKKELEDVRFISESSTCVADAVDKLSEYLIIDVFKRELPKYEVRNMAFNLYQAVTNKYKYLKLENKAQ